MVDEVADRYQVDAGRFLLFGFSGGGHFAHRFLYLHPERLLAASIGAPGAVTLLDPDRPWPAGVAGTEEEFGRTVDPSAVAAIPVHLVIGADDTDLTGITTDPGGPAWIPGVNDAGVPRTQRLKALHTSLTNHHVPVTHQRIPATAHDANAIFPATQNFFAARLVQAATNTSQSGGVASISNLWGLDIQ